jgi:hypothetical protein
MRPDATVLLPSGAIPLGEPRPIELPATEEEVPEPPLVQQVRQLLQDVVHIEPPPVRLRVPTRLAKAKSLGDLGELVEIIEQCLRRAGHSLMVGEAATHIATARELLGLGNTRIQE